MDTEWTRGDCIGRGSFGTVSLTYTKPDGQPFAVKSAPSHSHSLENEICILRSLAPHPNIVCYLGDSRTQHLRNLHIEYVPGGTIADRAGSLDEWDIRGYTRSVLRALSYLHSEAHIVHGDVKGRNILAGQDPEHAKLTDFGSARRVGGGPQGAIGGTPLWMAPEVLRGEAPAPGSDVWSVGCTVIEMVTGAHPWRKYNSDDGIVFRIAYGDDIPEFPVNVMTKVGVDFLEKCLRRDIGQRWSAERLLGHPFLAEDGGERSPRSTLDWFLGSSEFDEVDDDEDDDDDDLMELGMERIRELAENCGAVDLDLDWDWGSEERWEVVRCSEEQGMCSGSELCSLNSECSCSDTQKGEKTVEKERRLNWGELFVQMIVLFGANPVFLALVLQLVTLYRYLNLNLTLMGL